MTTRKIHPSPLGFLYWFFENIGLRKKQSFSKEAKAASAHYLKIAIYNSENEMLPDDNQDLFATYEELYLQNKAVSDSELFHSPANDSRWNDRGVAEGTITIRVHQWKRNQID